MRYAVTYHRTPIELPDGRMTTDSFRVIDRSSKPYKTLSEHVTRDGAIKAAAALGA